MLNDVVDESFISETRPPWSNITAEYWRITIIFTTGLLLVITSSMHHHQAAALKQAAANLAQGFLEAILAAFNWADKAMVRESNHVK
jgi:hypothetical protein